jgi:hypothetical protein
VKIFTAPFRPELYRKHLQNQHSERWLQYQSLNMLEKKQFFIAKQQASLDRFVCSSEEVVQFTIAKNIVEELVGSLYFHPEDDAVNGEEVSMSKASALKLFQLNEDGES